MGGGASLLQELDCALLCSVEEWSLSDHNLHRKARTLKVRAIPSPRQALLACREAANMQLMQAGSGTKWSPCPTLHCARVIAAEAGHLQSCLCLRYFPRPSCFLGLTLCVVASCCGARLFACLMQGCSQQRLRTTVAAFAYQAVGHAVFVQPLQVLPFHSIAYMLSQPEQLGVGLLSCAPTGRCQSCESRFCEACWLTRSCSYAAKLC